MQIWQLVVSSAAKGSKSPKKTGDIEGVKGNETTATAFLVDDQHSWLRHVT